ncbi:MAG: HlyD family secretion protein [Solitalea-like symbiont of Tyrophagus putrescentiae]
MKYKTLLVVILHLYVLFGISCKKQNNKENLIEAKLKRDTITIASKIPGRIVNILVKESDVVQKGDTLAEISTPEIDAKILQAQGAVEAAQAQYNMAKKGATSSDLDQLQAKYRGIKAQFDFAKKSLNRVKAMFNENLIPAQQYDEVYAKYQGAKAQFDAVNAQLKYVKTGGVRSEEKTMALGQLNRAHGALKEALAAKNERFIIAPDNFSIESIALQAGELALPGYGIFTGYLPNKIYFRFTAPASKINKWHIKDIIKLKTSYNAKTTIDGTITYIKQLTSYADITTAYPNYEPGQELYEVHAEPVNINEVSNILTNATLWVLDK